MDKNLLVGAVGVAMAALFSGCDASSPPADRALIADVVAQTQHCGGERISSNLVARFSRWRPPRGHGQARLIVQACVEGGGCRALVSYDDGLPPRIETSPERITVTIAESNIDVHSERVRIDGAYVPVVVEEIDPRDASAHAAFRRSLGFRQGSFHWQCEGAEIWTAALQSPQQSGAPTAQ